MKICLVFENLKSISKSGIGRAYKHQKQCHEVLGIETTEDWKNGDYDILHINTYGLKSKRIIRTAKKKGAKVIYHAHSTEEDFKNSFKFSNLLSKRFKKWISKRYKMADFIITPTPYSKELLDGYGLDTEIVALSNGIDLKRFKKDTAKEAKFKEYFKIGKDEKTVVAAGLWIQRKGILDFVEIAAQLPEYKFIWFGDTPKPLITRKVKNVLKNHSDNVTFAGYIKGDIIQGAFSGADCFFFPSHEETEGIVILEAMASSQNLVIRNIGAYNGWMVDKINCYTSNDNSGFLELIPKVINRELPDTSKEAHATATERSIEVIAKELMNIYNSVLKK